MNRANSKTVNNEYRFMSLWALFDVVDAAKYNNYEYSKMGYKTYKSGMSVGLQVGKAKDATWLDFSDNGRSFVLDGHVDITINAIHNMAERTLLDWDNWSHQW